MKVAIFGSSGPVFQIIMKTCLSLEFRAYVYGRHSGPDQSFDIHMKNTWPTFVDADVMLVVAWDMNLRKSPRTNPNIEFALHLLRLAIERKQRLIFVSSVSAHDKSKSNYGRSKHYVEKEVLIQGMEVIKLGFLESEDNTHSTNKTQQFLKFIRALPIGLSIKHMGLIPTLSGEYLERELKRLIPNPKSKSVSIIEKWVSPDSFFVKKNKILWLRISKSTADFLIDCGVALHFCPLSIADRWKSLNDAVLSSK